MSAREIRDPKAFAPEMFVREAAHSNASKYKDNLRDLARLWVGSERLDLDQHECRKIGLQSLITYGVGEALASALDVRHVVRVWDSRSAWGHRFSHCDLVPALSTCAGRKLRARESYK